jgi:carboxymethylenebutenolidase
MPETNVDIRTRDGRADSFLVYPDHAGPHPAVIYIPDIRGPRPVFKDMARRLASHGYAVLMPNLFYRLGPAPVWTLTGSTQSEAGRARVAELFAAVTVEGCHRDHVAFLDYLASIPEIAQPRTAEVGYCMGGAVAMRAAADFPDRIIAAACFHGGRLATDAPDSPHLRAKEIRARLYFGHAADDGSMTPEMIEKLEAALNAAHVRFTTDHYTAHHGYAVADSPAYEEDAAEFHWTRLVEFLRDAFGGR